MKTLKNNTTLRLPFIETITVIQERKIIKVTRSPRRTLYDFPNVFN